MEDSSVTRLRIKLNGDDCAVLVRGNLHRHLPRRVGGVCDNGGVTIVASRGIGTRCKTRLRRKLRTTNCRALIIILPTNRRAGSFRVLPRVCSRLLSFRLGQDRLVVTLNNNIVKSLTKFTTTDFLHNIPFVRVPASLLTRISDDVKNGINMSLTENGGLIKTFCRPGGMFVSPRVLGALSSRFFHSNLNRIVGCNYVGSTRFFDFLRALRAHRRLVTRVRGVLCAYYSVGHEIIRRSRGSANRQVLLGFNRAVTRTLRACARCSGCSRKRTITVNVITVAHLSRGGNFAGPKATTTVGTLTGRIKLPARLGVKRFSLSDLLTVVALSGGGLSGRLGIVLLGRVKGDCIRGRAVTFFSNLRGV